jgi:hypothetical protein
VNWHDGSIAMGQIWAAAAILSLAIVRGLVFWWPNRKE